MDIQAEKQRLQGEIDQIQMQGAAQINFRMGQIALLERMEKEESDVEKTENVEAAEAVEATA